MNEEGRKFHNEVLNLYREEMYSSLIYEHNVVSDTLKEIEFEDSLGSKSSPIRGFFAKKDRHKYFLTEKIFKLLPIRVKDKNEELIHQENVIIKPLNPTPFKITPEKKFEAREFIDGFLPFEHSNPMHFLLMKMVSLVSCFGRTYICIASEPNFAKTSAFDVLDSLTDRSPVFKPRSVPGVLNHINGTGNIVFDEVHDCKKEIKEIMEEFALQIGGGKSTYINGALKSAKTKMKYSCTLQSITFLYNSTHNYGHKAPKIYFDFIFSNNKAIDNRFLKIKFDGELTEKFDRNFNLKKEAVDNKGYYVKFAKQMLYYQELKQSNGYERRYNTTSELKLRGRRKNILDEITWLMDMYAKDQEEYDTLYYELEKCILSYREMINAIDGERLEVIEESVE